MHAASDKGGPRRVSKRTPAMSVTDNEIKDEGFLEFMNNVLASGEVRALNDISVASSVKLISQFSVYLTDVSFLVLIVSPLCFFSFSLIFSV